MLQTCEKGFCGTKLPAMTKTNTNQIMVGTCPNIPAAVVAPSGSSPEEEEHTGEQQQGSSSRSGAVRPDHSSSLDSAHRWRGAEQCEQHQLQDVEYLVGHADSMVAGEPAAGPATVWLTKPRTGG